MGISAGAPCSAPALSWPSRSYPALGSALLWDSPLHRRNSPQRNLQEMIMFNLGFETEVPSEFFANFESVSHNIVRTCRRRRIPEII